MEQLPNDPFMLVSFLNMKLRDEFDTPADLCRGLDIDPEQFETHLKERGVSWFADGHRFVV